MRAEEFTDDAPGMLVPIPRPATEAVRAAVTGTSAPTAELTAFLPDPLPPAVPYDATLAAAVGRAMLALGQLDAILHDLPNPSLLVRPLLRREAVESSRIEGTVATLDDLVVFAEAGGAEGGQDGDVLEVKNYLDALEYALAQPPDRPVSAGFIRDLHTILLQGVHGEDQEPGRVRTRQNFIGRPGSGIDQARYVPPPPWQVDGLLSDLERYLRGDDEHAPLVRIALAHYQFEAIHPFLDGNGRVGRLLVALLLQRWGVMEYPAVDVSAYVARHRQDYLDRLLGVSQRGDWRGWIDFFLAAVETQGRDAARRSRALLDLRREYGRTLRRESRAVGLDALLDRLFERTTVTARQASELLGVSFTTAQGLIQRLEGRGVLEEATGRRRDRVYRARQVIAVLDGRRG